MSEAKHSPLTCPFCGKEPVVLATHENDNFVRWYSVHCDECGIKIGEEYEDAAISAWNTRAATSLHHELVAALEEISGLEAGSRGAYSKFTMAQSIARAALQKAKQGDKQ